MKINKFLVSCFLVCLAISVRAAVVDIPLNPGEGISVNAVNGVLTDPETLHRSGLNRHYTPTNLTQIRPIPSSAFIITSGSARQLVVEGNSCFYVGSLLLNCGETSEADGLPTLPGTGGEGTGLGGEGIGDQTLVPDTAPVPIPAAVLLLGSALISLFGAGWRKHKT